MKAWLVLLFAIIAPVRAGNVVTDVPAAVDPAGIYLIYLHGRIVEDRGPRPTGARFGLYDYPAILDALSSRGATVISAQRGPGTDVDAYAGIVISQIERLLQAGVPPKNIVVVGFSKGGAIAVHVSSFLRRPEVRFVLLAACWDRPDKPQLRLTGHVLSLYETGDTLTNSCKPLAEHSEQPESFKEIILSTGKAHGAFYTPRAAWDKPVLDWVHGGGT